MGKGILVLVLVLGRLLASYGRLVVFTSWHRNSPKSFNSYEFLTGVNYGLFFEKPGVVSAGKSTALVPYEPGRSCEFMITLR
eukprot:jgi/Psemu1/305135/fgenesh1_kg.183_\